MMYYLVSHWNRVQMCLNVHENLPIVTEPLVGQCYSTAVGLERKSN